MTNNLIKPTIVSAFLFVVSAYFCVILPFDHADEKEREYVNQLIEEHLETHGRRSILRGSETSAELMNAGALVFKSAFNHASIIYVLILCCVVFSVVLLSKVKNYWMGFIALFPLIIGLWVSGSIVFLFPYLAWFFSAYLVRKFKLMNK